MDNLLKKAYELYNTNRTGFSKISGIKYKTLESWESNGCSEIGAIAVQKFIDGKENEIKHKEELEKLQKKADRYDELQINDLDTIMDKAERFDVIQKALNIVENA